MATISKDRDDMIRDHLKHGIPENKIRDKLYEINYLDSEFGFQEAKQRIEEIKEEG